MKKNPAIFDLISLKGKTALITGASAGIGRAIAIRLAEAGANIELVSKNINRLRPVKTELIKYKIKVDIHRADLSSKNDIESLWQILDKNVPDILVNNAGIYPFENFLNVDDIKLRKIMDTNLTSVFWMCQKMIKRRGKRGGVIINIGSIEALLPFKEDLVPYTMSKAGVLALTRALAKEYGKKGFRINAILPGGIITPGTKSAAKEINEFKLGLIKTGIQFKERLPAGRLGQPDEVARVALFLASDLSSYMHGSLIPVDGGFLSA
ncbi:SDR family NAD(P)-dependent oxidoreductase [Patescibacteria group bacterium]